MKGMAGRVGKMGFDGSGAMGGDGDRNGGPRREPDHHGPRRTGPRAHRLREVTVCVCVSELVFLLGETSVRLPLQAV